MAQSKTARTIEDDAKGQFTGTQHGGGNNGVTSATPRVLTGTDDATFKTHPEGGPSDRREKGKRENGKTPARD